MADERAAAAAANEVFPASSDDMDALAAALAAEEFGDGAGRAHEAKPLAQTEHKLDDAPRRTRPPIPYASSEDTTPRSPRGVEGRSRGGAPLDEAQNLPREPSAWASLDDPATPSLDDSSNGMNAGAAAWEPSAAPPEGDRGAFSPPPPPPNYPPPPLGYPPMYFQPGMMPPMMVPGMPMMGFPFPFPMMPPQLLPARTVKHAAPPSPVGGSGGFRSAFDEKPSEDELKARVERFVERYGLDEPAADELRTLAAPQQVRLIRFLATRRDVPTWSGLRFSIAAKTNLAATASELRQLGPSLRTRADELCLRSETVELLRSLGHREQGRIAQRFENPGADAARQLTLESTRRDSSPRRRRRRDRENDAGHFDVDGFITTCFAEEGIRGKFLMSRLLRGGGAGAPPARGSNRMKMPPPPPVRGDPGAYQRDERAADVVRTNECPCCLEKDRDTACVPCGHTMCSHCVGQFVGKECPVCREEVKATMKVFLS